MQHAKITLAQQPCLRDPTAVVLVTPGRLSRQAETQINQFGRSILEQLGRRLSQFRGEVCGIILDPEVLQTGLPPKIAAPVCSLLSRTRYRTIVYADQINERDRDCSALAIAQQIIGKAGLDAERDTILLTGSGWDQTDQPTDLLGYAFRGLGFSVVLDPHMRLPPKARSRPGR